jgi:amino acid adenylation domain-containing protein
MPNQQGLHSLLEKAAESRTEHEAIVEPGKATISYDALGILSDRVRDRLIHRGVRRGDRVGIYLRKSIDSVAAILGVLKAGAAYVPVDPFAPPKRNAYILNDCSVQAVLVEGCFAEKVQAEIKHIGGRIESPLLLDGVGGGRSLKEALAREEEKDPAPTAQTILSSPDDLAYILYTSGSTGKPKGVMLSHKNAMSFVDWCSEAFEPSQNDRFSSHAPFHFDLSILDIYVPIKHGSTLVLIGEELGKDPVQLASLISQERISIWYSTPSILSLLAQYGKLEQHSYESLRIIHFAGEVFPLKHLRALKALLPGRRYFNLYGPTETNVCTYFELPAQIPEEQSKPYPIGKACSHVETKVVNEEGQEVPSEEEGELCVTGAGVMLGYWNLPERTARAFLEDSSGRRWYRTGDMVVPANDGNYIIVGRRDRMVKKRGYRIELGEVETALYRYPSVKEAAVIALADEDNGVRIKAFLSCRGVMHPSIIELKHFCSQNLPSYMIPDIFAIRDSLPKTSTDKIDYQTLKEIA